jgi:hypothetical protein
MISGRRTSPLSTSWTPTSDDQITATIVDRLPHRGIVVAIDGPFYRMRAHQQRT